MELSNLSPPNKQTMVPFPSSYLSLPSSLCLCLGWSEFFSQVVVSAAEERGRPVQEVGFHLLKSKSPPTEL